MGQGQPGSEEQSDQRLLVCTNHSLKSISTQIYSRNKETQQTKIYFCVFKWRFGEISFENFLLII